MLRKLPHNPGENVGMMQNNVRLIGNKNKSTLIPSNNLFGTDSRNDFSYNFDIQSKSDRSFFKEGEIENL